MEHHGHKLLLIWAEEHLIPDLLLSSIRTEKYMQLTITVPALQSDIRTMAERHSAPLYSYPRSWELLPRNRLLSAISLQE